MTMAHRHPGEGAPRKVLLCGDPDGRDFGETRRVFLSWDPGMRRGDGVIECAC